MSEPTSKTKPRYATKEEYDQIAELLKTGMSQNEISRRLGRDLALVSRIASGKQKYRPRTSPMIEQCRKLRLEVPGIGIPRIAKALGLSFSRARDLLRRARELDGELDGVGGSELEQS